MEDFTRPPSIWRKRERRKFKESQILITSDILPPLHKVHVVRSDEVGKVRRQSFILSSVVWRANTLTRSHFAHSTAVSSYSKTKIRHHEYYQWQYSGKTWPLGIFSSLLCFSFLCFALLFLLTDGHSYVRGRRWQLGEMFSLARDHSFSMPGRTVSIL
jgi:hypothetical protein